MDLAYSVADLVISRAGAGTISELCLVGKPTILIPSPNVSEDHQTKNAMALVDKNAALIVKEIELDSQFELQFSRLMANKDQQKKLSANIKKLALINATKDIVEQVVKLINK